MAPKTKAGKRAMCDTEESARPDLPPRSQPDTLRNRMAPFTDFQVALSLSLPPNPRWLATLRLQGFAALPWLNHIRNTHAHSQAQTLRREGPRTPDDIELTPLMFAGILCLPCDGLLTWEKASDEAMQARFGPPEPNRLQFLRHQVPDINRRNQLGWFMEKILLLVKLDYLSKDTFGLLLAAESGTLFNWGSILYHKFCAEVFRTGKQVVSGKSKIPALLSLLFVQPQAWRFFLPTPHDAPHLRPQAPVTEVGCTSTPKRTRRHSSATESNSSAPPPASPPVESSTAAQPEPPSAVPPAEESPVAPPAPAAASSAPPEPTPPTPATEGPQPTFTRAARRRPPPAKISISLGPIPVSLGDQSSSQQSQQPPPPTSQTPTDPQPSFAPPPDVPHTSTSPPPMSQQQRYVSASVVCQHLQDSIGCVTWQQQQIRTLKLQVDSLRDTTTSLISMYQAEKLKCAAYKHLQADMLKFEETLNTKVEQQSDELLALQQRLSHTQVTASKVTAWFTQLQDSLTNELQAISQQNTQLRVECGVLRERVKTLEGVEQQIQAAQGGPVDLDAVILSKDDLDELHNEVLDTGKHMWTSVQQNILSLLHPTAGMFTVPEVSPTEEQLQLQIKQLEVEQEYLKTQVTLAQLQQKLAEARAIQAQTTPTTAEQSVQTDPPPPTQ